MMMFSILPFNAAHIQALNVAKRVRINCCDNLTLFYSFIRFNGICV